MSRRTRNSRKKEPSARSAACKKKMATIAEDMEGESIDSLLDDFDIQSKMTSKPLLITHDIVCTLVVTVEMETVFKYNPIEILQLPT